MNLDLTDVDDNEEATRALRAWCQQLGYRVKDSDGDVNFAVRGFDGYGKLSGKSLDDLRAGERVEVELLAPSDDFYMKPLAVAESFGFAEAAQSKALIAATHMPFPGVGRIMGDAGALRWLPTDWSYL